MAKLDLVPVVGIVAIGARAFVMVFGQCMARLAIRIAAMIERYLFPILGIVAVGALPGVMVIWGVRIVLHVAGLAILRSGVIKGDVFPISGIGVAIHTRAEIQRSRTIRLT